MGIVKKSNTVPQEMQEKYQKIVQLTDRFCEENLNEEYAQLLRLAVAALCRKRPSPLNKGRENSWASGITHAIGSVNFVFDRTQTPWITPGELYKKFGVGESTGQSKSRLVRKLLNIREFDHNWILASKLDDSPMSWMLSVNGMMVDIRTMPREVQEIALEKGLIAYIPE